MATVLDFSQEERGSEQFNLDSVEDEEFCKACIWTILFVLGKTGLEGNAAGWLAGILGQHRSRQETVATYFVLELVDLPE